MKKIRILFAFLSIITISCKNKSHEENKDFKEDNNIKLIKITLGSISPREVDIMKENYKSTVRNSPDSVIRQINMDGVKLKNFLTKIVSLKLILAFNRNFNENTVILKSGNESGTFDYSDIKENFDPSLSDVKDKSPLICTQVARPCELINVQRSANQTELSEITVDAMSKAYFDFVRNNPDSTISTISFDGVLLKTLLEIYNVSRLKLIPAAYRNADGTYTRTIIMQFFSQRGAYYYYDANIFFTLDQRGMYMKKVICPPPSPCEI